MGTTATSRFRRLLLILPHVADGRKVPLAALADEVGVSADLILDDLRALTERYDDLPGWVEEIGVLIDGESVQVRTSHFHRPMRLTVDELCALELGLALMERERTDVQTIRSLRVKLASVIGTLAREDGQRGRRDGALGGGEAAGSLAVLRAALRANVVVAVSYQASRGTDVTERLVHPHRLTFARGTWYLAAWCERHGGPRVFRVDRMQSVALTDTPVTTTLDTTRLQELDDGTPFVVPESAPAFTVHYSPGIARWIAERDGQPLEADGSAVRTMPLADREWAIRHVLRYGPDAEVVEPADLREELIARLS